MTQCIGCDRYTLREHPASANPRAQEVANEMAKRHQLGRCTQKPAHLFLSPTKVHSCQDFAEAPADAVAKRRAWIESK